MKTYTYETANKFGATEVEFKAQYDNHKKSFTLYCRNSQPFTHEEIIAYCRS